MICPICVKVFEPIQPRQLCCSKKCGAVRYSHSEVKRERDRKRYWKKRDQLREQTRNRYKTDETYRNKYVEAMRKRRLIYPERVREINAKHRSKPESRKKAIELSSAWHKNNREHANTGRIIRKQTERITYPWRTILNGAKARAKKKGISFGLTEEWLKQRWTGKCELSGIPFTLGLRGVGAKLMSPSVDKIHPKKGYTQDNCRIILWALNAFKYDGHDDSMYLIAEALLKNRKITSLPPLSEAPTTPTEAK